MAAVATSVAMTEAEMRAQIAALTAQNAELEKRNKKGVYMKVSEKGGVSVYGLGRFPVTLYKEQWEKLLDMGVDIRQFITDHDSELKSKGDKE